MTSHVSSLLYLPLTCKCCWKFIFNTSKTFTLTSGHLKGIGHCKNMNCYTLGHPKILGAEAFRDWNSDSRRSKHWYINNVTKNGSQYSWEKYLQTKNSGAPTVACDEDLPKHKIFNSVLPNVGFLKGWEVGDGALIQMRYFCLFKIIWKWVKKNSSFVILQKKKIPQPRKCHASASRVFSFFAQRYLHNLRLILHVITTMATTKTQTGLPTK